MRKLLVVLVVLVGLGFVIGCAATTQEEKPSPEKKPAATQKTEQQKQTPKEQPKTEPKKEEPKK